MRELTQAEYEELQIKVNETYYSLDSELRRYLIIEKETFDTKACSIIDNILFNIDDLISNYGTKFTAILIIDKFIENT